MKILLAIVLIIVASILRSLVSHLFQMACAVKIESTNETGRVAWFALDGATWACFCGIVLALIEWIEVAP